MSDREQRLTESDDIGASAPRARGRRAVRADSRQSIDERDVDERGYEEREATEDRELSDDERLEMFRDSLLQSVLPDLPDMPGYHVCWLTTSNGRDTIQRRKMLGYELLSADQIPGWEGTSLTTGELTGCVMVNEMVAARIPIRLYNRYMQEAHHAMPLSEEEKLRSTVRALKQQAEEMGTNVLEGDGTAAIVQRAGPMPDFAN
jgi:hypothetical protein